MKDYSKKEFMHDVQEADRKYEQSLIDYETYIGQIKYFAKTYGSEKTLAKEILNNRIKK